VGRVRDLETYPEPRNTELKARYRWLPFDWTLDPWVTIWEPYSGNSPGAPGVTVREFAEQVRQVKYGVEYRVEDFIPGGSFRVRPDAEMTFVSEPGVNPQLLPQYDYFRSGGFVRNGAVGLRQGRHMWSDTVNWAVDEVTVIVVAVMHLPDDEWMGVLEVENTDLEQLSPYFGVRYHRTGVLGLWADSLLASVQVESGITRPAQPIVLGMNIDMANNACSLLSVDRNVKIQTTSLPHRYDNRSRLWLGRSTFGQQATSNMEILEVSYWDNRMGPGDLAGVLGQYDRMYGVTS